jgi:DNA polymerase delta subunit 1
VKNYNREDLTKTPAGEHFVKPHIKKGILPLILEELIVAKEEAKHELASAVDPFKNAVCEGK